MSAATGRQGDPPGRSADSVETDYLELIMDTCSVCGELVKIQGLVWDLREELWRPLVVCETGHEEVIG